MGLFDIVAGIGKAAVKSIGDAATKQSLEAWEKMRNAPHDRLRDFYNRNNTTEQNNARKRALALAAIGNWEAQDLLRQDQQASRALRSIREQISLETSNSAKTLRDSIDRLIQ